MRRPKRPDIRGIVEEKPEAVEYAFTNNSLSKNFLSSWKDKMVKLAESKNNKELMKIYFEVFGDVQGIMFRQTFVRCAMKYGLKAAASNDLDNYDRVLCFLEGEEEAVKKYIEKVCSGKEINSWGAKVLRYNQVYVDNAFEDFQLNSNMIKKDSLAPDSVNFYL